MISVLTSLGRFPIVQHKMYFIILRTNCGTYNSCYRLRRRLHLSDRVEYRIIPDDRPSTYCRESSFTTHGALHYSFIHSNHECESLLSAGIQLSLHLCNALNIINYVLQYGQKSIAGDLSRIVLACRSSLFVLHSSVSVVVKHYLLGRLPITKYLRTVASNYSKIKPFFQIFRRKI